MSEVQIVVVATISPTIMFDRAEATVAARLPAASRCRDKETPRAAILEAFVPRFRRVFDFTSCHSFQVACFGRFKEASNNLSKGDSGYHLWILFSLV